MYWKLLTCRPSSETPVASRSTNAISTIRDTPAAISVYPNAACTSALAFSACGCADMPQPVRSSTKPGTKFRLGAPSPSRLSQMPARPAHHHTTPMVVCCQSLARQSWPHLCSVKVLTHPHAAMTALS